MKRSTLSRRAFLAATGGAIVTIGLPGVFIRLPDAAQKTLASDIRADGKPRLPPGQVAVKRIQDMGGIPGTADTKSWRLRIYGEVEKPLSLSYKDLLALEQVDVRCDIHCVTGWTLLDSEWIGVRLSTVINLAVPLKSAAFIVFEAASGYTSNIPLSDMHKKNVILAHTLFGERLPKEHGAPARALVPDRYLYKSAKWVEAIKITSSDEPGFWEKRGYSNSADPWKEERYR